jgi:hypothetical protein
VAPMSAGSDPTRPPGTPAFRRTARGRVDLYRALLVLEQAGARPATGREPGWLQGIGAALDDLLAEVDTHIEITEGRDGLYQEIAATEPRLAHALDELRAEHAEMRARTETLAKKVGTAAGGPAAVDEIRDEIGQLLGFLVKHRQRGSDLVWQAYELDIGGDA